VAESVILHYLGYTTNAHHLATLTGNEIQIMRQYLPRQMGEMPRSLRERLPSPAVTLEPATRRTVSNDDRGERTAIAPTRWLSCDQKTDAVAV
jgi:hypothetical protein